MIGRLLSALLFHNILLITLLTFLNPSPATIPAIYVLGVLSFLFAILLVALRHPLPPD